MVSHRTAAAFYALTGRFPNKAPISIIHGAKKILEKEGKKSLVNLPIMIQSSILLFANFKIITDDQNGIYFTNPNDTEIVVSWDGTTTVKEIGETTITKKITLQ